MSEPSDGVVDEPAADGVPHLARLLGVQVDPLREAIGGPWSAGEHGPEFGHLVTIFTGLENPRVPSRPVVALRVDHDARTVEVGRAIGVPLLGDRYQWSLGEPRASIDYDEVPLDEVWGAEHSRSLLVDELGRAVSAVLDATILRGTTW